MLHYNYIFFNSLDGSRSRSYPNGYNSICVRDLEEKEEIEVVSSPLYYAPHVIRILYGLHHSEKVNRIFRLPFKRIWYPYYFKSKRGDKPFAFILLNHDFSIDYLQWLKNRYPDCAIVLLHRDLKQVCLRSNPDLPDNPLLDLEMTIDKGESKKYGYPWYSEYESKIEIPISKDYPESDVFFAGRDKGRLHALLDAYSIFTKAGLKVFFYITGVRDVDRKVLPGIIYADENMSYVEMLRHTVNTRCVLEINQENADGYTSRFLEAVIFGKRLITNNTSIKSHKFYKSGYIQVVEDMSDIDVSFIADDNGFVDYNYQGEFSPLRMIERIDEELIKKNGSPNFEK